jgi:hypothetical protein
MKRPFIPLISAGPLSIGIGPVWIIGVPLIVIIAIIKGFTEVITSPKMIAWYETNILPYLMSTDAFIQSLSTIELLIGAAAIIIITRLWAGYTVRKYEERMTEARLAGNDKYHRDEKESLIQQHNEDKSKWAEEARLVAEQKRNGDEIVAFIMNTLNNINYSASDAPVEGPKRAEFLEIGDVINKVMNGVITYQQTYNSENFVALESSFIELKERIDAYLTPGHRRA